MIRNSKTETNRLVSLAISGGLLVLVLAVTLNSDFYERMVADPFFSITLGSFTIVFVGISRRPKADAWQLAVLAAVLVALQMLVLKVPFKTLPAFAMLATGALLLVALRRLWSQDQASPFLHYAVLPPLLLILMSYWGSTLLGITGSLHPRTLDISLYDFDQSLGVQLSCKVGQVVLRSHGLRLTAVSLYYGLPLAVMFVYSRQLLREKSFALTAFLAFLVAGPIGVVFYNLVPGCGPICLLGSSFPYDPPSLLQLTQLSLQAGGFFGPRNAFPSLHMGWALLAWWYSDGLSWRARVPVFLFLVGTAVAALAVGEHYFVDLIAAFPLAVMIEAGCALQVPIRDRRRFLPLLTGLILLLGWVALIRGGLQPGWGNPILSWMLVAGTVALSLRLHAQLRVAALRAFSIKNAKAGVSESSPAVEQS